MLKKGLINSALTPQEMEELLDGDLTPVATDKMQQPKMKGEETMAGRKALSMGNLGSASEVTIYKRAFKQIAPELEQQIDKFVAETHEGTTSGPSRKGVSSSSEELMDISDETADFNVEPLTFVGKANQPNVTEKTPEERADEMVREAEKSRAQMFDIPGKQDGCNIIDIDNDYQMIDSHIDEGLKHKILEFEYVNFSKLLNKSRARDDHQRLEIVNRKGMTFLSPVSDREVSQISNFGRWEQAFRVFSNVLTLIMPANYFQASVKCCKAQKCLYLTLSIQCHMELKLFMSLTAV